MHDESEDSESEELMCPRWGELEESD